MDEVPRGDGWVHELKLDGYRIIALVRNGRARLITRGTLEGDVEVKVGDNLEEKMGQAEIVVEDDLITEIRDPAAA